MRLPLMDLKDYPLGQLHEDQGNVRKHSPRNIEAIKASLTQFGQVEPLVVERKTMKVVGGNGRLTAMRELGWEGAHVVLVDLTATEAVALGIALNRTGELASWDYESLGNYLKALQAENFSLESIGWSPEEAAPLLTAEFKLPDLTSETFDLVKMGTPVQVTKEQRAVFDQAAAKVRAQLQGAPASDGRCLELLCAEFIGGG